MRIEKIPPVIAPRKIPYEHLEWCGIKAEKKQEDKKLKVNISSGDFTLYDSCGKIVVYTDKKESYNDRC